jgi:argininosuccinate lyase
MLQQSGLAVPKFERVTSIPDACLALDRIALPVVVKPSTGSGSVCVRLCRTLPEVVEHMELLLSRTTNERGMPVCPEILIEEYLLGDEYSVETFGEEVLGITRKHVSAEPFFVELGHDFPAVIDAELAANISMVSRNALSAMGLAWGPTHIELRVTSNGPVIVEINPRLAGGFIPEIVRLAYNIDMIRETVRLATGANVNISPGYSAHASIRFLVPQTAGVIKAIRGVEDAMQIRGVVDVRTYRSIGDSVRIEHDFRDRIGHVIACDELAMNAARNSDVASNKIHFEIRA